MKKQILPTLTFFVVLAAVFGALGLIALLTGGTVHTSW